MFPSWLKLARWSFSPPARPRRQPLRCRPFLERLETRTVPGVVTVSNGVGGSLVQLEVFPDESAPISVSTQGSIGEGPTRFYFEDPNGLTIQSFFGSNDFLTDGPNIVFGTTEPLSAPVTFRIFLDDGDHALNVRSLQIGNINNVFGVAPHPDALDIEVRDSAIVNDSFFGGSDAITLGGGDDVWSFQIPVTIEGLTTGVGTLDFQTTLTLDDSLNPEGLPFPVTVGAGQITGLGNITYSGLSSLDILGGAGNYDFLVQGTSCPTTISGSGGSDNVNVGSGGSVHAINAPLTLLDPGGSMSLTVDDSADTAGGAIFMTSDAITGLAPAAINYADLSTLTVNGPSALSFYEINGTPASAVRAVTTNLFPGAGGDVTLIESTSAGTTLNVDGGGGSDQVSINGNSDGVQGIEGSISVQNPTGSLILGISDGGDGTGRTATLTASRITGLAPAAISWDPGSLASLSIEGPAGPSTFTITGTPSSAARAISTTLTDAGADQVFVQTISGTGGAGLTIEPSVFGTGITLGNATSGVQNIAGAVSIVPFANAAPILTVDDSADKTGRNVTISSTSITGLAPGKITYSGLSALNVPCGTGFYGISVQSTAAPLTLNGGGGTDFVTIGNSSSVQAINAPLALLDPNGEMLLVVDDSADGVVHTNVVITSDSIAGLAPATISYAENDLGTLVVKGTSAGSSYHIAGTPASSLRSVGTSLAGGPNADFVQVEGTSAGTTLTVNGGGGKDTVQIDDASRSVQSVQGSVLLQDSSGSVQLQVFDDGDGTGRTATISSSGITGLAPAAINWVFGSIATLISTLTVSGPAAPSTFLITGTPAQAVTTTLNDEAADQVFVQNPTAIAGTLNIQPLNNAAPTLTVDDSADSTGQDITIGSTSITSVAGWNITYAGLAALNVHCGTGNDRAFVQSTVAPLTLNGGGGFDSVTIGNSGSVQAINAPVTLLDPNGAMRLTVDDSADASARTVLVASDSITGLAPATISYAGSDLSSLTVDGSSAASTYTVIGTPASAIRAVSTNLVGGPNSDNVQVEATSPGTTLKVDGGGGNDNVLITDTSGSVENIAGSVRVENPSGFFTLSILDAGDGVGRTATLFPNRIQGLAPAAITWDTATISSLSVTGPSGPSVFTVAGTPSSASLPIQTVLTDDAADQVFVQNTAGAGGASLTIAPLFLGTSIALGNPANGVRGIAGAVSIQPAANVAPGLTVDNSGDPSIRSAVITGSTITGLAPAAINYAGSQLDSLTVKGGSGSTTFNVQNTSVPTTLRAGAGSISVAGGQSVQVTSFVGSQMSVVAGNGQSAAAGVASASRSKCRSRTPSATR
jgi:hypothetical protein